jgi:hypothetical protein
MSMPYPDRAPAVLPAAIEIKRLSWGAVIAGAAVAIAVQILFAALGLGLGASAIDPSGHGASAGTLGVAGGIWGAAALLISLFVGGLVAAHLSGRTPRVDGALHGLVVWAAALVVGLVVLGSAVGSAIGMAGDAAAALGAGVGQAVPAAAQAAGLTPDKAKQEVDRLVGGMLDRNGGQPDATSLSPDQARQEIVAALTRHAAGEADDQATKDRVIAIVAAQLNISQDEARGRYEKALADFDQLKDQAAAKAKSVADQAAKAAAGGGFLTFATLLLAAAAAAAGGAAGAGPRRRI